MPKSSDGMSKGFAFIEFKNPQVSTHSRVEQGSSSNCSRKQEHGACSSQQRGC